MGYFFRDLFPCSCQLSPEWLEEQIISGEADQSKPDVLPDFVVVPRMVLGCFMLELPFLIVCMFMSVHDPLVVMCGPALQKSFCASSGPLCTPQMLKRLLQRTNLSHLQKVSLWDLVQVVHPACCRSDFTHLAQPRSLHSICCDINTCLSFCCQPVAEYSGDGNSAGTWDIIYSMQTSILDNIKTWNKTHKGWLTIVALPCFLLCFYATCFVFGSL